MLANFSLPLKAVCPQTRIVTGFLVSFSYPTLTTCALDPVLDICHINTHDVLNAGVEIVIDGNMANTMFWKCDVGVQSEHSRVSAKSGQVFCDTYLPNYWIQFHPAFSETQGNQIMRCDSDSGKKLIKSMVLRTADRQGMC